MENKIIYGDYMRDNLNSLIRRLLSGITNYLVRVREGGRVSIPTPRRNVQQYRPVPAPRIKKQQPVAAPTIRIGEEGRALKGLIYQII